MMTGLSKIFRPQVFHGKNKTGNYFEGWFYKLVDSAQKNIYAFIPGIFIGKNNNESHAFIQVLENKTHNSSYFRFPLHQFEASTRKLHIRIGENLFTDQLISVAIHSGHRNIRGTVTFENLNPWPVSIFSPGIMGWYAYIPFMQCYHGVVSLDHPIHGALNSDDEIIDFNKGRGYIEKDWGTSFPDAYVWIQSNHFQVPGISLIISVAKIPWLSGSFRGFIIGLFINGTLYRFTTYTGARLNYLKIDDDSVRLKVQNRKYRLTAIAKRNLGGILHAPYEMKMLKRVSESLNSTVDIRFIRISGKKEHLIFEGTGVAAGLDVNGNLQEIIDC